MPSRSRARLLALAATAALLGLRLAGLYARLQLRLAAWRARSRLAFRVKARRLPGWLARELAAEYDRAVSGVRLPGVLEVARLAPRARRARGRG